MKIIRDKEEKSKTKEEKKLDAYKKAKNIGLASLGVGGASILTSKMGIKLNNKDMYQSKKGDDNKGNINLLKAAGIGLSAAGLGLHGYAAIKYNALKRKLKKEKEENDNPEKKD